MPSENENERLDDTDQMSDEDDTSDKESRAAEDDTRQSSEEIELSQAANFLTQYVQVEVTEALQIPNVVQPSQQVSNHVENERMDIVEKQHNLHNNVGKQLSSNSNRKTMSSSISDSSEEEDDESNIPVAHASQGTGTRDQCSPTQCEDDVPAVLPYGCVNLAPPDAQNLSPDTEKHLWRIIVQGPAVANNTSEHKKKWDTFPSNLTSISSLLHIPLEHRINVFSGNNAEEILRSSLDAIYAHAASAYTVQNPMDCICTGTHTRSNENCGSLNSFGGSFFMGKRAEIRASGFGILGGFLRDDLIDFDGTYIPSNSQSEETKMGKDWYQKLLDYYQDLYEQCEKRGLMHEDSQRLWHLLRSDVRKINVDSLKQSADETVQGRCISTKESVMELLNTIKTPFGSLNTGHIWI